MSLSPILRQLTHLASLNYFSHIFIALIFIANQFAYYFWVIQDEHKQPVVTSQHVLGWIALGFFLASQLLIIFFISANKSKIQYKSKKLHSFSKDFDGQHNLKRHEFHNEKIFRFVFLGLTIGCSICFGYSNIWVSRNLSHDHLQLLILSLVQIALWHEIRDIVTFTEIAVGSLGFLISALISSENLLSAEIFFIFLAFVALNFVLFLTHKQHSPNETETFSGRDLLPSESENGHIPVETNVNPTENPLITEERQVKRIPLNSIPHSHSMGISSHFNIQSDNQMQKADQRHFVTTRSSGTPICNGQIEATMAENKLSRILFSNHPNQAALTSSSPAIPLDNNDLGFNENLNSHLEFYKGMIERLDSAIFVIGGPNDVYEPLNSKAQTFFEDYFEDESVDPESYDYPTLFNKIRVKDYNKSSSHFLSSIGISKIEKQPTTQDQISSGLQKRGTLRQFFSQNHGTRQQSSPNVLTNISQHSQQQKQNQSSKLLFGFKTSYTIHEDQPVLNKKSTLKTMVFDDRGDKEQQPQSNSKLFSFPEITLLDLISRILKKKELSNSQRIESIEVIEFESDAKLQEILKFTQIKLYTYLLNGEQFLFLQFLNNQEREELMRQNIHKDIEYQTFKTISHELGTYTNFIIQILEGAASDNSIPDQIKTDYFDNLKNNANLMNCIIQDIRDYNNHLNNDLRIKITSTMLRPLIYRTCKMFQQVASMKQIEFEVLINSDVPAKIFSDKMKIQQILVHLIQNALKFSKRGGTLCLSLSFNAQTNSICFSVCDNGIGMDENEIQRLHKLLDNIYLAEQVSHHSSGFGFGLTISNILAKKILFQRGGENNEQLEENQPGIHFTSQKGVGSEFRFYLNTTDGENIVAQSQSTETDFVSYNLTSTQKGRFSKIKINEYEYFEIEDELEISEKKDLNVHRYLECKNKENDLEQSLQFNPGNTMRTLSVKLTKNFENISKPADKSRFFSELHSPLEIKTTQSLFKTNVERMQRQTTRSYFINSLVTEKSQSLSLAEQETDEEIKTVSIPHITVTKQQRTFYKILIADDEMMNIFGLKMILKILGIDSFSILTAVNGQEALEIYQEYLHSKSQEYQIKLILMDINMPVMDGLEATQQIFQALADYKVQSQGNAASIETNIVACTSYDDYDTKLNCFQAGMVSYLSKPCNKEGLSHILNKYFFK